MGIADLSGALKHHKSGWVSISADYKIVLAHSRTLEGLISKLNSLDNPKGIIMKAAPDYNQYVGTS